MTLGFVSLLMTNSIMLLAPKVLQRAIDALRLKVESRQLLLYAGMFLGITIAQGVFRYLVRQTVGVTSRRIEYDVRSDLYRHLQRLPLSYYHRMRTGDIMSRCTNDLQSVRNLLGPGIMYSLNAVIVFLAVLIIMLTMNVKLTLLSLVPMFILPLFSNRFGKLMFDRSKQVQEQIALISGMAQESISGIRVVKAYGREANRLAQFRQASLDYVHKSMGLTKIEGILWPMMGLLSGLSSVIALWYGGSRVIVSAMTLGELVAFQAYLLILMWPMMAIGWVVNMLQRGAASMGRICELLDTPPEIEDTSQTREVQRIAGGIEFRHLTFAYDGRSVLRDITLKVEPGTTLAIIGPTGAGKSTLVNLIPRLFDPPPGTLFIDGVDVRHIPLHVLRRHIGCVPQDAFLFSRTIAQNIAYGILAATDEQVRQAAEVSQILKDVQEFPDQFDTMVGERGVTLSGGQKQRTTISRAVITDPRILILDDSLSSVDTYTEEAILTRLRTVMRGRTSLIVSHRISTIKDADWIIVLDDGRIVEQGTHDDLVAAGGLYASIYEKQLLTEALEQVE